MQNIWLKNYWLWQNIRCILPNIHIFNSYCINPDIPQHTHLAHPSVTSVISQNSLILLKTTDSTKIIFTLRNTLLYSWKNVITVVAWAGLYSEANISNKGNLYTIWLWQLIDSLEFLLNKLKHCESLNLISPPYEMTKYSNLADITQVCFPSYGPAVPSCIKMSFQPVSC